MTVPFNTLIHKSVEHQKNRKEKQQKVKHQPVNSFFIIAHNYVSSEWIPKSLWWEKKRKKKKKILSYRQVYFQ